MFELIAVMQNDKKYNNFFKSPLNPWVVLFIILSTIGIIILGFILYA